MVGFLYQGSPLPDAKCLVLQPIHITRITNITWGGYFKRGSSTFRSGGHGMNYSASKGQRYICSNPHCRCEMEVRAAPGSEAITNPRCVCASPMKWPYQKPTITKVTRREARKNFGNEALD